MYWAYRTSHSTISFVFFLFRSSYRVVASLFILLRLFFLLSVLWAEWLWRLFCSLHLLGMSAEHNTHTTTLFVSYLRSSVYYPAARTKPSCSSRTNRHIWRGRRPRHTQKKVARRLFLTGKKEKIFLFVPTRQKCGESSRQKKRSRKKSKEIKKGDDVY